MKIYWLIFCLLGTQTTIAQRLEEKSVAWQSGQRIALDLKYAHDIRVTTWERDEVSVRVSVSINDNTKNDAWSMTTDTSAERIRFTTDLAPSDDAYEGDCQGRSYYQHKRSRFCSLIVYEIYVPRAASLRVETLGGNVTLRGVRAPVFAKSLSGFVDADWPAQQGATVTMKSVTGEVYTDLDLGLNEATQAAQRRESPVGWEIRGTVAGGGVTAQFESISNDVYFRRAGS